MEAVGLLGGCADGQVTVALPLPNLAGFRASLADPLAQFEAERTLRRAGLAVLGVYHSHPGGGPHLSAADRLFAARRAEAYVVIAAAHPHRPGAEMRAYRVRRGRLIEITLRVE